MKIVVTGGAGFLGSRVIAELLRRQDAGDLTVDFDHIVSLDLAENTNDDARVRSVVGDLADPDLLAQTLSLIHI